MMTYSCRRPRGSTTEFGEQRGEIAAREGPLERLRRVDVVFLEAKKPLTDSTERTEVIRREDLALDDGEIDLNLIEIYFSVVQRKVLTPNDFGSLGAVRERLLRFQEHYVDAAKPFQWTFTRRDLTALLAKLGRRPARAAA